MGLKLKNVSDQVIVITGASSGIGLTTAELAAARGARVVLNARSEQDLRQVCDRIRSAGGRAVYHAGDVADPNVLQALAETAIRTFGGFDTWVNDAAAALYGRLEEIPIEDQRHQFEVNYWGVVNGSLIAARHLRERGGGAIINLGSVLSERAMLFQTQYSATKHAVKAFTDGLRMELEREGAPVSVTLIKPSAIDTPYPEHARNYMGDNPALPPPIYDPHLVAKAIVFAAEHQKRDLTVGFGGWMIGALGAIAPRLTDVVMELVGYATQSTRERQRESMRDNLYRPRQDGDEYSSLAREPRKTSVFLAAQMHPFATAVVLAGIGAAVAAFLIPRESRNRPRPRARSAVPARRSEQVTTKTSGNGHSEYVVGPGYRARHEPFHGRPQPRH